MCDTFHNKGLKKNEDIQETRLTMCSWLWKQGQVHGIAKLLNFCVYLKISRNQKFLKIFKD